MNRQVLPIRSSMVPIRHKLHWPSLTAVVFLAVACSSAARAPDPGPAVPLQARSKRSLDATPRRSAFTPALPAGSAQAFFALDTGRDQLASAKEAGLELVVRFGATELRQTIASCAEPALGSALGGGTSAVLEVAICGSEIWLQTREGRVFASRVDGPGRETVLATIALPAGVARAVSPPDRH